MVERGDLQNHQALPRYPRKSFSHCGRPLRSIIKTSPHQQRLQTATLDQNQTRTEKKLWYAQNKGLNMNVVESKRWLSPLSSHVISLHPRLI